MVALAKSPFLGFALVGTIALFPIWMNKSPSSEYGWISLSFSMLPTLMGFTLTALSIILVINIGKYSVLLHKQKEGGSSHYMKNVSSFFHAIFIQFICIVMSLLVQAYNNIIFSGVAFFFFCYALTTALAAAGNVVTLAKVVDKARYLEGQENLDKQNDS